jgi:hypothetical protein
LDFFHLDFILLNKQVEKADNMALVKFQAKLVVSLAKQELDKRVLADY